MAERRPLVVINGTVQEVPIGDEFSADLLPAGAPSIPLVIGVGETFTVSENTQALYAVDIVNDGVIVIDGELVRVS